MIFPVFVAASEASGDVLLISLGPFPKERIQGLLAADVRQHDELAVAHRAQAVDLRQLRKEMPAGVGVVDAEVRHHLLWHAERLGHGLALFVGGRALSIGLHLFDANWMN